MPIRILSDGAPDWEDTVADMLRVIADLTDSADTAISGRFKRDTFEALRQADRDKRSAVEHCLADRGRELHEQRGE